MTGYTVGIDVGDRSVGCAAVRTDEHGVPLEVLAAVSHIHDGGIDGVSSSQSAATSRLASAGAARRGRRRFHARRRRLAALDGLLRDIGAPPVEAKAYEPWQARARLVQGYLEDDAERLRLVGIAVRHIARHRGWRNPWWGLPQLSRAETPSEAFTVMLDKAAGLVDTNGVSTVGQLGWAAARPGIAMRPRTGPDRLAATTGGSVFSERIRQEDVLAELDQILTIQRVPDATKIRELVFHQNRPHVPAERVGKDPFDTSPRATRASLAFQRFRVLAAVANLAGLDDEQRRTLTERLLAWRDQTPPRWPEVAEWLGVGTRTLRAPHIDDEILVAAPTDRTSTRIEQTFTARSPVGRWWREASTDDREAFVEYLADATVVDPPDTVLDLLDSLDDKQLGELDAARTKLESGRAAYGLTTLTRLSDWMLNHRGGLYDARTAVFGTAADWSPPADSLTDPIEHPTLQRINNIVRQFLSSAVMKWGLPDRVVIEHVRGSFLGPDAYRQYLSDLKAATNRAAAADEQLRGQGVTSPKRSDRVRYAAVQRQNGVCLYCGAAIGFRTCELDHIVPDARGGSNRTPNLAAVCRDCNAAKSDLPFAVWATNTPRAGVSLDNALTRVDEWTRGEQPVKAWRRLTGEVKRRLKMTDYDTEERLIESTAYGAREMRARVGRFLADEATRRGVQAPPVNVYAGAVTAQARAAGGVSDRLRLRDKTTKTRFDRRHHAIDAAVLTTLRHTVAEVLAVRSARRAAHNMTGDDPDWKHYQGSDAAQITQYRRWLDRIHPLAELLAGMIDTDRIPVVYPRRLRPTNSKIHKDGIAALDTIPATAFTPADIARIPDPRQRQRVLAAVADGADVTDAVARICGTDVAVFTSASAYIAVREGQSSIGETVHHARVYAYRQGQKIQFGQVRVFAGEFPQIGFHRKGVDVLTAPLPDFSQALLTAPVTIRKRLTAGDAHLIGWLAVGDEIVLDPSHFTSGGIGEFLSSTPETRWIITGLPMPDKIGLVPAYLAAEGIDNTTPPAVARILQANRIILATNVVLGSGATVIRRTALGAPRWKPSGGLPVSWYPLTAAETALGQ